MNHKTTIKSLGPLNIPDPDFGDQELKLWPFVHTGMPVYLPQSFKLWEPTLNAILKHVPLDTNDSDVNKHYVTIHSEFFSTDHFMRRAGVHMDGNFCVDPKFGKTIWNGVEATFSPIRGWGGVSINDVEEITKPWVAEHEDNIPAGELFPPIGDYVSEKDGGIFTVSSEVGCQGWQGKFTGDIEHEGSYANMKDQLTDDKKVVFDKNTLYFMTSNTPHETLYIKQGKRRTFMRVTLNHDYDNTELGFMRIRT